MKFPQKDKEEEIIKDVNYYALGVCVAIARYALGGFSQIVYLLIVVKIYTM